MKETEEFTSLAIREFEKLKKLSDNAVSQITKEQFFLKERETDNSVAVIYKHVAGNMISRWTDFLTTDGEKPNRNRDAEFIILESDSYESLIDSWEKGWSILLESIQSLSPSDILGSVKIRGERLSVLQAIARELTHYAYHVGQIVFLAKHHAGDKWGSLSIPVGKSANFNRSPRKYIEK